MAFKFGKKHYIVIGLLASFTLILVLVLGKGLKLSPNKAENAQKGLPAKDSTLTVLQSSGLINEKAPINLSSLMGKPMILNFWASWCVGCREEAKILEQFWKEHKQDVLVVGVAVQDTPEDAMGFVTEMGKTYPILLDESGLAGINYGVTGVPETFFISRGGMILDKIAGPLTQQDLELHLKDLEK